MQSIRGITPALTRTANKPDAKIEKAKNAESPKR